VKTMVIVILFLLIDGALMLATPLEYRKDYWQRVLPGGGIWIYAKYEASKP